MASVGDLALEPHRTFIAALGERLLSERERWPLWLPGLIGGGIAIYFMLDQEPARWIGGVVLALAGVALRLRCSTIVSVRSRSQADLSRSIRCRKVRGW
jgi:hypothetical protein